MNEDLSPNLIPKFSKTKNPKNLRTASRAPKTLGGAVAVIYNSKKSARREAYTD